MQSALQVRGHIANSDPKCHSDKQTQMHPTPVPESTSRLVHQIFNKYTEMITRQMTW